MPAICTRHQLHCSLLGTRTRYACNASPHPAWGCLAGVELLAQGWNQALLQLCLTQGSFPLQVQFSSQHEASTSSASEAATAEVSMHDIVVAANEKKAKERQQKLLESFTQFDRDGKAQSQELDCANCPVLLV